MKCLERKLKGEKECLRRGILLETVTSVDACPDSSAHHFFEDEAEACWYQFSHYHAWFFYLLHLRQAAQMKTMKHKNEF